MGDQEQPKREVISEDAILRLRDAISVFDLIRVTHNETIKKAWAEVDTVFKRYHFVILIENLGNDIVCLSLGDTTSKEGGLVFEIFGANETELLENFEKELKTLIFSKN